MSANWVAICIITYVVIHSGFKTDYSTDGLINSAFEKFEVGRNKRKKLLGCLRTKKVLHWPWKDFKYSDGELSILLRILVIVNVFFKSFLKFVTNGILLLWSFCFGAETAGFPSWKAFIVNWSGFLMSIWWLLLSITWTSKKFVIWMKSILLSSNLSRFLNLYLIDLSKLFKNNKKLSKFKWGGHIRNPYLINLISLEK